MDVEKLQKINALANELKKHNFAAGNDEAFKQAESVYDPKQQEKKPMQTTKIEDSLSEKRFEIMLQMNNKRYDNEISMLKSALRQLAEEFTQMKQKIHERPAQRQEPPKPVQKELKTEPKQDHPKQGKFTSDDVDIQKMFYFGTKR